MTDLKNGKIDIFGFEVTENTTQEAFEEALGSKFTKKCLNPKEAIHTNYLFALNGQVCVSPENFVPGKHTPFEFYGMTFVNVLVLFRENRISEVELVTDMDSYDVDDTGNVRYSDEKNLSRFYKMNSWAIESFGTPTYQSKNAVRWAFPWGMIQPSSAFDNGCSKLYIDYRKER